MQITYSIIISIFFSIRQTSIAYAFDTNVDLKVSYNCDNTSNEKFDKSHETYLHPPKNV